jgi:predicted Rossmann fold nucleotide-binding protein DprA/Smf involved in DNA uptake
MSGPMNTERTDDALSVVSRIRGVAPEASGAASGALIGLAIGGPIGALSGAVLSPAGAALARLVQQGAQRRAERAVDVLASAAQLAGSTPDDIVDTLSVSEDRFALAIEILAAAADTPLRDKRRALARLLAESTAAHSVDIALVVARALNALDESHMAVLFVISDSREGEERGLTPEQMASRLGMPAELLRYQVRLLELYGLITDAGAKHVTMPGPIVRWQITALGQECVKLLANSSNEEGTCEV